VPHVLCVSRLQIKCHPIIEALPTNISTSPTLGYSIMLHYLYLSIIRDPLLSSKDMFQDILWMPVTADSTELFKKCFLLLYWVGVHCGIYKSSYMSNISYLNSPSPPFSFILIPPFQE
jgi:hypothetical protein